MYTYDSLIAEGQATHNINGQDLVELCEPMEYLDRYTNRVSYRKCILLDKDNLEYVAFYSARAKKPKTIVLATEYNKQLLGY